MIRQTGLWIGVWLLAALVLISQPVRANGWSAQDYDLYPGDFDGDGVTDILYVAKDPNGASGIARGIGGWYDSSFQSWNSTYLGIGWSANQYNVVVLQNKQSGNHRASILLQAKVAGGTSYLLIPNATGHVTAIAQSLTNNAGMVWSADQHHIVAGDFNGDGLADVFLQASTPAGTSSVIEADSNGEFTASSPAQTPWSDGYLGFRWAASEAIIYAGDFNGDGYADLLIQARPAWVMIQYDVPFPVPTYPPNLNGIAFSHSSGAIFSTSAATGETAGYIAWSRNAFGIDWSPLTTTLQVGNFNGTTYTDILAQALHTGTPSYLVSATGTVSVLSSGTPLASNINWSADSTRLLAMPGVSGGYVTGVYFQALTPAGTNSLASSILGGSVTTTTEDPTAPPGSAPVTAGFTPGGLSVSPKGEAVYAIDLRMPPGVVGLVPKLSLVYSSDSGNGRLGVDWNLQGLSEIDRCPQTLAQDGHMAAVSMAATDRLCLDGVRLVLVSGTYGGEGTEYRTESDSLTKVVSHTSTGSGPSVSNGPAWFEVWSKAGQYSIYGNSADSRVLAVGVSPATARVWAINRMQDARSNYVTYSYTQDSVHGDYYPNQISYGGNSNVGQAPLASVSFGYSARPDIVTVYQAGAPIQGSVILNSISTYAATTLVRTYTLHYGTSSTTGRSEILSIQECAGTASCLPASQFTWTNHTKGFTDMGAAISGAYAGWSTATDRMFVGDVNGDGIADIVLGPDASGNWYVMLGTGTGFSDQGAWITGAYANWSTSGSRIRMMDVNGDGLQDIVIGPDANGNWYVLQSTGHSFVDKGAWVTGKYANWASSPSRIYPIDVNGDGRQDIMLGPDASGNWYVLLSTGTSFTDGGAWASGAYAGWATATNRTYIADVNGDGLQDVVLGPDASGNWYVLLSTGSGFVNQGAWITGKYSQWAGGTDGIRALDLNGDGLQDIEMGPDASGNWYVLLSTGKSFVDGGAWATGKYANWASSRNRIYATDTNGDGLQDLVIGPDSNGAWYVLRSTGSSFVDDGAVISGAYGNWATSTPRIHAMDLNGDGLRDFVMGPDASGNWYHIDSNTPNEHITAFNNGIHTTNVTYASLTNGSVYTKDSGGNSATYPIVDMQFPAYVVSSLTADNGIGGTITATYKYGGFKFDLTGRGMLGMRWNEVSRQAIGTFQARTTHSEFQQQFPYTGLLSLSQDRVTTGGSGGLIKQLTNSFGCLAADAGSVSLNLTGCVLTPGRRYFPYVSSAITSAWDLNGTAVPTTTNSFTYDGWGNVLSVGTTSSDGFSRSTTNTYQPADTVRWILGRLSTAQSTSTTP